MDTDDLREALASVLPPARKRRGQWVEPATADDEDVAAFGRQLGRFLEELPGDLSISELRELMEEAIAT